MSAETAEDRGLQRTVDWLAWMGVSFIPRTGTNHHNALRLCLSPVGRRGRERHEKSLCYAIWDQGVTLQSVDYNIGHTLDKIDRMPVSARVREDLKAVLTHGGKKN